MAVPGCTDWGSGHLADPVRVMLQERPLDRWCEGADVDGDGQPLSGEARVLDGKICRDDHAPRGPHDNCSC